MTVLDHIKELALNLTPEEKDALAQYLADSNGEKPPQFPRSLALVSQRPTCKHWNREG